jgi:hypothetical protein
MEEFVEIIIGKCEGKTSPEMTDTLFSLITQRTVVGVWGSRI